MTNYQRDLEVIINEVGITNNGTIRFIMRYPNRMKGDLTELGLSDRSYNALRRNRIQTIQEVSAKWDDFVILKGVGKKVQKEVRNAFMAYYYDQLNAEEQKDFWRDTLGATEELAETKGKKRTA